MYEGFVRAIDDFGTESQKEQLMTIMLKTVESNPANILSNHETLIDNLKSHFPGFDNNDKKPSNGA